MSLSEHSTLLLVDPFYEPIHGENLDFPNHCSEAMIILDKLEPFRNIILDWDDWLSTATPLILKQAMHLYNIEKVHHDQVTLSFLKQLVTRTQKQFIESSEITSDLKEPFSQEAITTVPVIFIAMYGKHHFNILDLLPYVLLSISAQRSPKNPLTNELFNSEFIDSMLHRVHYLHVLLNL